MASGNENLKRTDYINWDEYFMSLAFLSGMRSKDPSTQVGACIVNDDNRVVGLGYNGFPDNIRNNDDQLTWDAEGEDNKYLYVCHAELNAVLNKTSADVKGCTIYVALFPCNECAKVILQSRIKEVVYYSDKYHKNPKFVASRKMLDMAGLTLRQYRPKQSQMVIDFTLIDGINTSIEDPKVVQDGQVASE